MSTLLFIVCWRQLIWLSSTVFVYSFARRKFLAVRKNMCEKWNRRRQYSVNCSATNVSSASKVLLSQKSVSQTDRARTDNELLIQSTCNTDLSPPRRREAVGSIVDVSRATLRTPVCLRERSSVAACMFQFRNLHVISAFDVAAANESINQLTLYVVLQHECWITHRPITKQRRSTKNKYTLLSTSNNNKCQVSYSWPGVMQQVNHSCTE